MKFYIENNMALFSHSTPKINSDGAFLALGLKAGGRGIWFGVPLCHFASFNNNNITLFRHLLKFEFMMEYFKAKLKDSYLPCEASALFLQVLLMLVLWSESVLRSTISLDQQAPFSLHYRWGMATLTHKSAPLSLQVTSP
jgi:hypothetical protein